MGRAKYQIAALPGDGIGREVMDQAVRVLDLVAERSGCVFEMDTIQCGAQYYLEHGDDIEAGGLARCKAADVILLGAVGLPSPDGRSQITMPDGKMAGWSPLVRNRVNLDLYANIRPVKLFDGGAVRISGAVRHVWDPDKVDMVFFRENTEGLYAGSGGILAPGGIPQVATDTRVLTRNGSERILRRAFDAANARRGAPADGKKRVTCVVKNNVLYGCKFFTGILEEVADRYPDVEYEVVLVDAFCQWLIRQPEHYDVVVTTNMFGDIVTELAAVLQGGMGMASGGNVGDRHAMFEPIHGSAPKLAGKNRANPMAMMLATSEALKWLGAQKNDPLLYAEGGNIESAVRALIKSGKCLTYDLKGASGAASMNEVTEALLQELARIPLASSTVPG